MAIKYSRDVKDTSRLKKRQKIDFKDKSKTVQADAKKADINNIMRKYEQTGILPDDQRKIHAMWGDFSNAPSYDDALKAVLDCQTLFDGLDANVKKRFGYNPQELLDFVSDSSNKIEAMELGLIEIPEGKRIHKGVVEDINPPVPEVPETPPTE